METTPIDVCEEVMDVLRLPLNNPVKYARMLSVVQEKQIEYWQSTGTDEEYIRRNEVWAVLEEMQNFNRGIAPAWDKTGLPVEKNPDSEEKLGYIMEVYQARYPQYTEKPKTDNTLRAQIIDQLQYELTTPRPNALKDDENFWKESRDKIGSLLCQAEELGKKDFDYITARISLPRAQCRDLIRGKRARDFIEANVKPMIEQWNAAIDAIRDESHRLDDLGKAQEPSELWSDLMNEILRLARDIDRKTLPFRSMGVPSYVDKTRDMIEGSVKLAYPGDDHVIKSTQQFFKRLRR